MPNRLSREVSPYLLQHARNPVDWYPWGPEALDRARSEDRPILLSVGYSSCHWCHVMERESFEDPAVAALMNAHYVSVKVDREERPDIDQIYMRAVQAMTGSGGWPMTVFLTPEGIPYYGGTYFPPEPRHGMPSFSQVLRAAADAWVHRRSAVSEAGAQLVDAIRKAYAPAEAGPLDEALLEEAYRALDRQFDETSAGFGRAPKFPQPVTLELLLRDHLRTGRDRPLEMAVRTLRAMAAGGIRDHLGGGFHRYSVDARWLVPHFEKMLYDNALLARAYLDAYRITGADDLRVVAEDTLAYLLEDMRSSEGGFYAARDADSEGEEGTFYLWSPSAIEAVLPSESARRFMRAYDVTESGNFEGRSILHLPHDVAAVAHAEGIPLESLRAELAASRTALRADRVGRVPPFRDEKILTSWNGMTLRALAEAGAALGRWDLVAAASETADFLWATLLRDGRLHRSHMDGATRIPGFLEDYAALGNALLSVHAATLEPRWLDAARWLCDQILERFLGPDDQRFYDSPADGESLLLRPRDPMDNATPSGASLAAELLLRAGHVFDEGRYREVAVAALSLEASALRRFAPAFGRMLSVVDRWLAPPVEVAIVGNPDDQRTRSLIQAAHTCFLRNHTIVGRPPDATVADVPLLQGRGMVDGNPTAYVCRAFACRLPVTDPEDVLAQLSEAAL